MCFFSSPYSYYEGPYLRGEGEGFAGLRMSGAMGLRFPDSNLRSGLGDLNPKRVHVPTWYIWGFLWPELK